MEKMGKPSPCEYRRKKLYAGGTLLILVYPVFKYLSSREEIISVEKNLRKMSERLYMIDSFRGLAIIYMVVYHAFYNVRYIFGNPFGWTVRLYPLQQAACWSFILVSGFSFSLSRKPARRGLLLTALGLLLTVVTTLLMPSERIIWGVLNLLGAAALLTWAVCPLLERVPAGAGLAVSAALFGLLRDVQYGYLGFEGHWLAALPETLYRWHWLFPLGFPYEGFWSADYFPVLPWIFLYWCGFYLFRLTKGSPKCKRLLSRHIPGLCALGQHSLLIYLLHQPVIFGVMWLFLR